MKIINRKVVITVALISILIVVSFLFIFRDNKTEVQSQTSKSTRYEVFGSEPAWGYQIILKGRVYISQKNIPAIQGNIPFKTKSDAEKVASLVLGKIKKNQNPSVSRDELDSLQIDYRAK